MSMRDSKTSKRQTVSNRANAQTKSKLGIQKHPTLDFRDDMLKPASSGERNEIRSKKPPKKRMGNPKIKEYGLGALDKTDPEKAREIRSKGGKAAVETRRKYSTMKACMKLILETDANNFEGAHIAHEMGLHDGTLTYRMLLNVAMVRRALAGSVAAYREICDMVGEGIMSDAKEDNSITIHINGRAKPVEVDEEDDEDDEDE